MAGELCPGELVNPKGNMKRAKSDSSEQIIARAEAEVRVLGVKFVGCTMVVIALSGIAAFFFNPSGARDVWMSIGPILTAAMSGMFGFWTGSRRRQQ